MVVDLRLPRIVLGLFVGAGLAVCGAVMQSIMKNPLADPYTTGVSSGALFGVMVAYSVLGAQLFADNFAIFIFAFLFSLIPTGIIVAVSKIKDSSPTVMIMAGIAVMYIFNAFTTLFKLYVDPNSLASLYTWQVGSLTFTSDWNVIPILVVAVTVGTALMMLTSRKLNVLATGDENARAMGLDASQIRIFCLVVVAFMAAVIVGFTGLIGFVGLVAPHVTRMFIGPDNRFLVPASALFGAALLVTADLVGQAIIAPAVLQVGVVTAFFGGPMFLWLVVRRKSRIWR